MADEDDGFAWDLTLLTDEELLGLESCVSKAVAASDPAPLDQIIPPELMAALERVKR